MLLTAELLRMSGEFERVAARLDTTLATVNALASDMQQGRGTLGLLMQDSTLYLSLVEANAELQSLLEDLQRNPRKYINLRVF
jgi:phospholipid/cholesterol/gamma-HCH transport system substrate-binding protein